MNIKYYKVGGYVRDKLLGVKSKDIDYAVEAPSYDAMKQDLITRNIKIFQERPEYFTIRGLHPVDGGVDYVLCRKDGTYSDGRRPDSVEAGTLLDDLNRREFTVNAMAESEDGTIIDPFGGQRDLVANLLRCVGNAEDRFTEDGLRILRAMRFSITRGFDLDIKIHLLLQDKMFLESNLKQIPVERKHQELIKCFQFSTLDTLDFLRDYKHIAPILFGDDSMWLKPSMEDR